MIYRRVLGALLIRDTTTTLDCRISIQSIPSLFCNIIYCAGK